MKVSVSMLKTNKSKEETLKELENSSADYIHVDLIDGWYVGEKNFTWEQTIEFYQNCQKELDIHLMTIDVEQNIESALQLHPAFLSFHYEVTENIPKMIEKIKKNGCKAGIAINPKTKVEEIIPFLDAIDLVLVLSVEPGYGGQDFIPQTITKLQHLKSLQSEKNFLISVDGGIDQTIAKMVSPYIDILVSGSYVCLADNFEQKIKDLKQAKKNE